MKKNKPSAITVCVDFDDLLALTLPRNIKHLASSLVITAQHDYRSMTIADSTPHATALVTDAFYANGAKFNKGAAIERAINPFCGRLYRDWVLMLDVDIVLPDPFPLDLESLNKEYLYGARRRMLWDPADYHGQTDWSSYPIAPDGEIPGCFQLFHSSASVLQQRPWFGTDWTHAGGYDSVFEAKFRPNNTRWLPFEILHLGQDGTNWYGRTSKRLDGKPVRDHAEHVTQMARMRRIRHETKSMDHERLT